LEFLDPDGLVDMPWRHLALDHAFANGFRPGSRLFIRHKRHRRHRIRAVARLAFLLKDWSDVLREGDRFISRFRMGELRITGRDYKREYAQESCSCHWLWPPMIDLIISPVPLLKQEIEDFGDPVADVKYETNHVQGFEALTYLFRARGPTSAP